MTLPYRWFPQGTTSTYGDLPEAGQAVAWNHGAWRVVSVTARPEELWSAEDREIVLKHGKRYVPHAVVLRPVDASDDPKDRGRDVHLLARGHSWHVFRDEHYPICSKCREPLPCRDQMAEKVSKAAAERMGLYEMAGVCPSCSGPVTARQRSMTFSENLEVIGGPPVTFHVGRADCRHTAREYEERWVAADPQRRKAMLTCPGHVTNHNDGTYQCTQLNECPGPLAGHMSYSTCRCPDCHARGRFGCHPHPKARLVSREAS
ncbi:hypothetical protein IMZ11_02605 [Microtetraspora sp. AC03309]|uniref:hypothetical protein n=1 Tax=Microtetraspora sp. AC03309 TaxID=2779376 RepID=UPI001E5FFEE6|nr:hypothetical protein [Microtetraspora sp. AC03309]MCC5574530.1 hypothetical protein [Microtetraspora sp. AC03309]